jgi:hypothetical protein
MAELHLPNLFSTQIWEYILEKYGTTNITQKRVYAYWQQINEDAWRLHSNQVESARAVLEAAHGKTVEVIPITLEAGISTLAFAFKEAVDEYATRVEEVAMDSTCKLALSLLV